MNGTWINLIGSARALSIGAHDDIEDGLDTQAPGRDVAWISPTRFVPAESFQHQTRREHGESPRVSWRLDYLEPAPVGTGVSG